MIDAAVRAGLSVLGVTDHDTTGGIAAATRAADAAGVTLVPGLEVSAVADGRDVHVLGYFIDPESSSLQAFLGRQRADRIRRVEEMAQRLAALGCPIDAAPVLDAAGSGRSVGRPQIAAALLAAGHVATRDEAFTRYLEQGRPGYVPRRGTAPMDVISIIHDAGGLASIAHPGVTRRDDLIPALVEAGLDALEARHSDHDAATERRYRELAAQHGLAVTGGSDFHGDTGHRVPVLGTVTLDAADFDRLRDRLGR